MLHHVPKKTHQSFSPAWDGMKTHHPSFSVSKNCQRGKWSTSSSVLYVPFAHISWQVFVLRALVWKYPICCSSVCLSPKMWIIYPRGLSSGSLYCISVCPFFFLVCSFPLPLFLSLYVAVVCLLAFHCECVWPLVNPLCPCWPWWKKKVKSLLQTRVLLPQSLSLPLHHSVLVVYHVCFSCLTF